MSLVCEVTLPQDHQAVFPERCVACGEFHPGSSVRLITSTIGWNRVANFLLMGWMPGTFSAKAPACRRCRYRILFRRSISLVITLAIVFLVLWAFSPYFDQIQSRSLRRLARIAAALVCLLPQIIIEVIYRPVFDITAKPERVHYEFQNFDCALDFAVANADAEFVLVNGEDFRESKYYKILGRFLHEGLVNERSD